MSTQSFIDVFNDVNETIQKKRIKKAGIYTKTTFTNAEFVEQEEDTKNNKKAYSCLLITFSIPDGDDVAEFEHRIFAPPAREQDVKFVGKFYDKGVPVRDLTPTEMISKMHQDLMIELIQLVQATGMTFEQAKDKLKPLIPQTTDFTGVFKAIGTAFAKMYANGDKALMDIKIVWSNSKKNQTSQLGISRATMSNLSYANHVPGKPTRLQISDYEAKECMVAKYTGKQNPPAGTDTLVTQPGFGADLNQTDMGVGQAPDTYNEDLF